MRPAIIVCCCVALGALCFVLAGMVLASMVIILVYQHCMCEHAAFVPRWQLVITVGSS
jgi:hypothetical protein